MKYKRALGLGSEIFVSDPYTVHTHIYIYIEAFWHTGGRDGRRIDGDGTNRVFITSLIGGNFVGKVPRLSGWGNR